MWEASCSKQVDKREEPHPGDHPSLFNEVFIRTGVNMW